MAAAAVRAKWNPLVNAGSRFLAVRLGFFKLVQRDLEDGIPIAQAVDNFFGDTYKRQQPGLLNDPVVIALAQGLLHEGYKLRWYDKASNREISVDARSLFGNEINDEHKRKLLEHKFRMHSKY